jgi:plastocyanin
VVRISAAVLPVIRRTRSKVALGLLGAAVIAAACAPASNPPTFPIAQGTRYVVQVPQASQDSGRAASIALDAKGNPAVSFLLTLPVPKPGVLPEVVVPGTPQPPSVMLASFGSSGWTRTAVTGMNAVGKAVGLAPEVADKNNYPLPGVQTSLALDSAAKHHIVWSTPGGGVFYSDDTGGSFGQKETITTDQAFGVSIALDASGTPWVSYLQGVTLTVATKGANGWTTDDVATIGGAPGLPALRTAIAVGSDNEPVVAYGDNGTTVVTKHSPAGWVSTSIPGGGGYASSLALFKDDRPDVAYYDAHGGIHRALSTGAGSWDVHTLGSTTAGPGGHGDARWGTGISVDQAGDEFVTWADTTGNDVMLATAKAGGTFSSVPMPSSKGGWTPALAVSADGTKLAVSWFDSVNLDLDVALPAGPLQLAEVTPTLGQPSVPPPAASCSPNGTSLQIAAPNGASASGFDTKCLATTAGTPFSVTFQNQDSTLHNFEIYTDSTGATRLGGASGLTDLVAPGASATYQVDALKAGSYFFRCDVHPAQMTGTFIVAGK